MVKKTVRQLADQILLGWDMFFISFLYLIIFILLCPDKSGICMFHIKNNYIKFQISNAKSMSKAKIQMVCIFEILSFGFYLNFGFCNLTFFSSIQF